MVFSSVPIYLDPPNWNQQQAHQSTSGGGGGGEVHQLPPGLANTGPADMASMHGAAGAAPTRPVSMSERARLAKIPLPEPALKCPRCESSNTKFCYFNNYSLSQPRHFCKTCRRYWTRGGALRNVPVGGGCRRNKRSKSAGGSSSKSSSARQAAAAAATSSSSTSTTAGSVDALPAGMTPQQLGQLPFLSSLQSLPRFGSGGGGSGGGSSSDTNHQLGLSLAGIPALDSLDAYHMTAASLGIGLEHWRLPQVQQQLPFQPAPAVQGLYPFVDGEGGGGDGFGSQMLPKVSASGLLAQLASVKMEDSAPGGLNLSRHYMGALGHEQYWGGASAGGGGGSGSTTGGWPADMSGFNSSPSGNVL